jgi:hypothetical protein
MLAGLFDLLHEMRGPDFLVLYAVWFALTFGTVLILRAKGHDDALTNAGGWLLFLGLGVARIIVGSQHGLHKWGYLIAMMGIGSIIFALRVEQVSDGSSGSSSWWSSCSTGGGCGSGGCGGGGCGGCGGG